MSIQVTGTVQRAKMGPGAWALVTDAGQSYELYKAPAELLKSGTKAQIQGQVRDDVMTVAMIGPVLEVNQFEVLSD